MKKNSPSPQLVNHAINVVLHKRYRRALRQMMPFGEAVITTTYCRETGKGDIEIRKRRSK